MAHSDESGGFVPVTELSIIPMIVLPDTEVCSQDDAFRIGGGIPETAAAEHLIACVTCIAIMPVPILGSLCPLKGSYFRSPVIRKSDCPFCIKNLFPNSHEFARQYAQ